MTDLWGYADLHCHPMAHLGFGGKQNGHRFFWGEPLGPISQSLACCGSSHSTWKSFLPLLAEDMAHGSSGHPEFESWPRNDTLIHQQMYVDWIKRAHASGLRLICALAVNNEYLAYLYHGGQSPKNSDLAAIGAQLAGMRRMTEACSDWMEIVLSPAHARRVIESGKLAVVLGVEVDTIGGWRRPDDATELAAKRQVDLLFAKGVRMITPIHLANNALGGCACSRDAFNVANHWLHRKLGASDQRWWQIDAHATAPELRGVEFILGRDGRDRRLRNVYPHKYRKYARADGHLNSFGLSPIGWAFIRRMMGRGMLVDIDHMSQRARDRVLGLAEDLAYPVISSHSSFRELGVTRAAAGDDNYLGVRHEGMLERNAVKRIRALGGMVGPITHVGPIAAYAHPAVPTFQTTSAQDTSHSWAHAYLYACELMGDDGGVAVGTDFNGFAQQPAGRFSGKAIGPARRVVYGSDLMVQTQQLLTRSERVSATKGFDFNRDGLAHYGLLPDFLRDVANQYGGEEPLVPFFRSAQRFIETWERCQAASSHVQA